MTSDLQKAADATAKLLLELQDSNDRLKIENAELQNQVNNLDVNYTRLQDAAGRALAERDYYMRECSELEGKFTSFISIASEALNTHRMAPFRPNGAAPKDTHEGTDRHESDQPTEGMMKAIAEANGMDDAIPEFLTKPIQTYGGGGGMSGSTTTVAGSNGQLTKIEGPLRLRRKI